MTNTPALPQHHRARLIAWTLAMLAWLAGVLTGTLLKPRHARQRAERASLWFLARRVHLLIIARAMDFIGLRNVRVKAPLQRGRSIVRAGSMRARREAASRVQTQERARERVGDGPRSAKS